jgi:hypothetical protein
VFTHTWPSVDVNYGSRHEARIASKMEYLTVRREFVQVDLESVVRGALDDSSASLRYERRNASVKMKDEMAKYLSIPT